VTHYRWLLLDADNTLFDFDAAEDFMLTRSLLHFGVEPTQERKDHYRAINTALWTAFDQGKITQEKLVVERYARFLSEEGISGDPAQWNRFGLNQLSRDPTLLPGAEQLCRRLAQRYTLALVTNGIPFVQRGRLELSPLASCFGPRVYISGELGCRKPERKFFQKVLESLGASRDRGNALMIGDSLTSDIRGAFNAQLDSMWLNRRGAAPGALKPTYEVSSLRDAGAILL